MKQGLWFAFAAYGLWGFLPIYWKLLDHVPSFQILLHRMVWSLGFLLLLLALRRDWKWMRAVARQKRTLLIYLMAALLLACNWGIYIWAVNANFIVETSLGYFISPLVSVFVGVLVFQETLRKGQWLAVGVAALGVMVLSLVYGRPLWIALSLAFSWNIYAALKKLAPLTALRGLMLETAILFLPALTLLIYLQTASPAGQVDPTTVALLVGCGAVTATPLLFFTAAARRLSLSVLGMMQYLAPTLQFLIGVFVYNEYFDASRLLGFMLIWVSLAVFSFEAWQRGRSLRQAAA